MDELSLEQILLNLPEARDLFPTASGDVWSSEATRAAVLDELSAMRQSESLGYLHHAEMHRRHALSLLTKALGGQAGLEVSPLEATDA